MAAAKTRPFRPLLGAEYDFPAWEGPPRHLYMIACTRRTGSNLLAMALWRTGVLGAPLEYLNDPNVEELCRRHALASPQDYAGFLFRRRTSPNGIFGYKAFYDHWRKRPALARLLRAQTIVFLRRGNEVAQAVSLFRAIRTRHWASLETRPMAMAAYDADGIAGQLAGIRAQNRDWHRFFRCRGIAPIEITYEEIAIGECPLIERLRQRLGVAERGPAPPGLPDLRRQADATSAEWERRFRRERPVLTGD